MTINNNYNFGLLTDDGTTSTPTSLQDLKSFTITYDTNTGLWQITSDLKDYFIEYYNKIQSSNGPGGVEFSGLIVYNTKGKNFMILTQNSLQLTITSANFVYFNGPGTIPNINNLVSTMSITYPELPTFINGYNGYNIPKGVLNVNIPSYTFYIMD